MDNYVLFEREHNYPFNHATATQTLTAGEVSYSLPSSTKTVDYNTFRLVKDSDLSSSGGKIKILNYNDYIDKYVTQEDEINTTTLSTSHTDSVTTITVTSTSGFDASGSLYIGNEIVTYTAIGSSTTFTGVTRATSSTTASAHDSGVTVAQFDGGGIPKYVVRKPDNNYLLYPHPTKSYQIKFDYFTYPSDLSAHDDTTTIPDRFSYIIVAGATAFVYQYRGEVPQYQLNMELFNDGIKHMQSLLVNRFEYLRSTYPLGTSSISRPNAFRVS